MNENFALEQTNPRSGSDDGRAADAGRGAVGAAADAPAASHAARDAHAQALRRLLHAARQARRARRVLKGDVFRNQHVGHVRVVNLGPSVRTLQ